MHKTIHGAFLNRRAEWFERLEAPSYVIWPIPAGHIPNLVEGRERLMLLREHGPSDEAFGFGYRTGPAAEGPAVLNPMRPNDSSVH